MSAARIRAEIVVLARYGPRGASSRLRLYQFIPALEGAGFRVTRRPMFSDAYVAARYRNPAAALARAAGAYVRRLGQLATLPRDAVLWVEYELLPWLPYAVERRLFDGSRPVVVEYDDAIFHRYDRSRSAAVRRWLGDKIDRIMRAATLVVAGNAYLAERARSAGAQRVEIIPTVIDLGRYHRKEVFSPDSFTVVDSKTGARTLAYSDVTEVRKQSGGISTLTWGIIAGAAAAAIIVGTVVVKPVLCDGGAGC